MAEATGLALGGIALASLVTTCVEFLEYFEDGRDCMRDFSLAVTKVKLMKIRLGQLGDIENTSVRPYLPDGVAGAKHHDWHHVTSALPDSASGISDIIERATRICRRYSYDGYHGMPQVAAQSSTEQQKPGSVSSGETLQGPTGRRASLQAVRRSISWAFHDKKKFNGLIADLDFILCNLEKIIEGSTTKIKPEPYRGTPPAIMNERNTSKKRAEMSPGCVSNSKKTDENNDTSKGLDAHASQMPAPPAGVARLRAQGPRPPSERNFKENQSRDQSMHFLGGQGDGDRINYQRNESHDQSLAAIGTFDGQFMCKAFEVWGHVAMHAITKQQQQQGPADQSLGKPAKPSVRDKQSSFLTPPMASISPKLTGTAGGPLCRN